MWIAQTVELGPPERPKKETKNMHKGKFTRIYKLKINDDNSMNIMKPACRLFYLSMLDLESDKMVTTSLLKKKVLPMK